MTIISDQQLASWRSQLTTSSNLSPHGSNLQHQLRSSTLNSSDRCEAIAHIIPAYLDWVARVEAMELLPLDVAAEELSSIIETYLSLLRTPRCAVFKSVSDLLTSAIPEIFLRVFNRMIIELGCDLVAVGQKDIWIDISFTLENDQVVIPKTQRVDMAIVKKVPFSVNGHLYTEFAIPVFAAEAKTYFDKNMISGVNFSVDRLKSTFRGCKYLAIGEWCDFDVEAQSYAASSIDEIYILRRQKRAAYRKGGISGRINAETVQEILKDVFDLLKLYDQERSDLLYRLSTGRLIHPQTTP